MQSFIIAKDDQIQALKSELETLKNEATKDHQIASDKVILELQAKLASLTEENEALLAQRKSLARSKDSLQKDFEKLKRELDATAAEHQSNIQRLTQANERLTASISEGELARAQVSDEMAQLNERMKEQERQSDIARQEMQKKLDESKNMFQLRHFLDEAPTPVDNSTQTPVLELTNQEVQTVTFI